MNFIMKLNIHLYLYYQMEAIGFNVNREKLDELAVKFKEEIARTRKGNI